MEVRARDFSLVRISVRRTVKVEPHKDNRLANPILVCGLGEFDLRAGHIEREVFPFVEGCQVKPNALTGSRESPIAVIDKALFHRDERVTLGLRDFDISHVLSTPASDSSAICQGRREGELRRIVDRVLPLNARYDEQKAQEYDAHANRADCVIPASLKRIIACFRPRSFELKHSGIASGVSRTHFNAPRPRPGDDEHGVLPDVAATDLALYRP
jgi:hypothetical protein